MRGSGFSGSGFSGSDSQIAAPIYLASEIRYSFQLHQRTNLRSLEMTFMAACFTAVRLRCSAIEKQHDGRLLPKVLSWLMLVGFVGCSQSPEIGGDAEVATTEIDTADVGVVTVSITRPDDGEIVAAKGFVVEDVATGTTVEELMRRLDSDDPGLGIEITGSGQTAFLNKMDGVTTGDGEGWTYRIDDAFVPKGIGVAELSPPTSLTWEFGGYFPE